MYDVRIQPFPICWHLPVISPETECFVGFTCFAFPLSQRRSHTFCVSVTRVPKASKHSRYSGGLVCFELLLIHLENTFFESPINLAYSCHSADQMWHIMQMWAHLLVFNLPPGEHPGLPGLVEARRRTFMERLPCATRFCTCHRARVL